jgi:hypothetical protein
MGATADLRHDLELGSMVAAKDLGIAQHRLEGDLPKTDVIVRVEALLDSIGERGPDWQVRVHATARLERNLLR